MADGGDKLALHLLHPRLLGGVPDKAVKAQQLAVLVKFAAPFLAHLHLVAVGVDEPVTKLKAWVVRGQGQALQCQWQVLGDNDAGVAAPGIVDKVICRVAADALDFLAHVGHAPVLPRVAAVYGTRQVANHAAIARLAVLQGAAGVDQLGDIACHAEKADQLVVVVGNTGDRQAHLALAAVLAHVGPGAYVRLALAWFMEEQFQPLDWLTDLGAKLTAALVHLAWQVKLHGRDLADYLLTAVAQQSLGTGIEQGNHTVRVGGDNGDFGRGVDHGAQVAARLAHLLAGAYFGADIAVDTAHGQSSARGVALGHLALTLNPDPAPIAMSCAAQVAQVVAVAAQVGV